MRPSLVTWRLSFHRVPTPSELADVRALLAPIASVAPAPDAGATLRDYGLSEHDFTEAPVALTPGELALACLTRAHRLATGWALLWPGTRGDPSRGWPADDVTRACQPAYLDGFTGMVSRSHPGAVVHVPALESGSFTVRLAPAPAPAPRAPPPPSAPAPLAPPATGPDAVAVAQAVLHRLVNDRTTAWPRQLEAARQLLLSRGARTVPSPGASERFRTRDGALVELDADGPLVRAVSFVLKEWLEPHRLDEAALEEAREQAEQLLSSAVASARTLLGAPAFAGGVGELGFPKDRPSELAALWPQTTGRILLEVRHDDRELPLQLCLAFAP